MLLDKIRGYAEAHPKSPALIWVNTAVSSTPQVETWTYDKVWTQGALIAQGLHDLVNFLTLDSKHIELGVKVGVMITEGPLLAISELAVHQAGMVIVPVDPYEPVTRLQYLLDDVECSVILCTTAEAYDKAIAYKNLQGPNHPLCVWNLTTSPPKTKANTNSSSLSLNPTEAAKESTSTQWVRRSDQISHIFFTSGSTGRPKGCICDHAGLDAYCTGKNSAFKITDSSICFVASAHTFDPSLGDFFACWSIGAVVATAPRQSIFTDLGGCLLHSNATHVITTPSLFGTLNPRYPPALLPELSSVALGGEPMQQLTVNTWAAELELYNIYGVTECNVYQSLARIRPDSNPKLLGTALPGSEVYIVDEDGCEVASGSGETGEIWLSGPQCGLEYLKRPEFNSQKYVIHPQWGKCFRTGDLAMVPGGRNDSGGIIFLGRRDGMVKVRGQRIELGEVEAAVTLTGRGLLHSVAVTLHHTQLVAWLVLNTCTLDDLTAPISATSSSTDLISTDSKKLPADPTQPEVKAPKTKPKTKIKTKKMKHSKGKKTETDVLVLSEEAAVDHLDDPSDSKVDCKDKERPPGPSGALIPRGARRWVVAPKNQRLLFKILRKLCQQSLPAHMVSLSLSRMDMYLDNIYIP